MAEIIIWILCVGSCAVLFLGIGIYAEHREKPMWFWAGSDAEKIKVTDVKAHNKAHGVMWKKYSLWFWVSGILYFFHEKASVILLVLACTLGIVQLYLDYRKIEKKYIIKQKW